MTDRAITKYVKDTFEENVQLVRDSRFLKLLLTVSAITNIVFALKFIFG